MSEVNGSAFNQSYEAELPGIGLIAQHMVKRFANLTQQELEYVASILNAELSRLRGDRVDLGSTLSDPKSSDPKPDYLGSTLSDPKSSDPKSDDLGSTLSDPKSSDPKPDDLGSALSDPKSSEPNSDDLGSEEGIHVPLGNVERKPITIKGQTYRYYYWRYWGLDGKHKSKYLSSSRTGAIAKVERIGIPPDARRY